MRPPSDGSGGVGGRFQMHHIGLAVPELEPAAEFLTSFFGYRVVSGPFDDPIQRVRVLFLAISDGGGAELELVAPLTEDSPIASMLKRSGGGTYHTCFETRDLEGALRDAAEKGCVVVSAPAPAVAFGGRKIAWIYTPSRQLFELLESAEIEAS